jgi:hypothetical protein
MFLNSRQAKNREDDWTGLTDAAARRKRQNRLNVRAHRRRKAQLLSRTQHPSDSTALARKEHAITCWVEDQQSISVVPASKARLLTAPIIPNEPAAKIIFPLSSDHLIVLLQFNVLRGCITNCHIMSGITTKHLDQDKCSTRAVPRILPIPSYPKNLPPSLQPTEIQRTVPHREWIDLLPHPVWRDNLILATGTFNENELWSDCIGGLFDGFPADEIERRGVIAWNPPWDVSGWEVSEGFLKRWGWSMKGCEDVVQESNRWRRKRGERPLAFMEITVMGSHQRRE